MDEKGKNQRTVKLSIITSFLLSIVFIFVILYFTVKPSELGKLSQITLRYEFFIGATLLNFLSWCLWGLRLKIFSNAADEDIKISWWKSTKIVMANLFLAGITPSMAGGEPVRIHLLNKDGMSLGSSTASVLGERLIDAIFLLICVPFAFFTFRNHLEEYAGQQGTNITALSIALFIGIIVFLITIFLFLYAIKKPNKVKGFIIWISKKFTKFSKKKEKRRKIIFKINREVDNFHNSMTVFLNKKKTVFFIGFLLTILMWLSVWLIPSMILMGLGLDPFFIESIAAQIFLIIIIMMPTTPGSSGVTESAVAILYSVIIGGGAFLGVFVIIFRIITYHMNLIVGAVFMQRIFKSVASFSLDMIKREDKK